MPYVIGLLILVILIIQTTKKKAPEQKNAPATDTDEIKDTPSTLNTKGAYKSKWLFSYNEKDAFQKLKQIAEPKGYHVLAKVRLLDLLEPVRGTEKYKTFLYKIQAKHVDFVICDTKLVARYIIELDDSSHNAQNRKERDEFVDTIVQNVGYKILHTHAITPETIEEFLNK